MSRPDTLLVVDDEPSIRLLCRVNLELDGYRVIEAGSLDEGRRALETNDVTVVLLDVHLGAEDGRELIADVRARHPSASIALLSGTVELERLAEQVDAVLPKPFELEALAAAVERLAARHAERAAVSGTFRRS